MVTLAINLYEQDLSADSLYHILVNHTGEFINKVQAYAASHGYEEIYLLLRQDWPEAKARLMAQTQSLSQLQVLAIEPSPSFLLAGEESHLAKKLPPGEVNWLSPWELGLAPEILLTLKGSIKKPGVYALVPSNSFLDAIYEKGGGLRDRHLKLKALLLGGPLGHFLPAGLLATRLAGPELEAQGLDLNSRSLMVFDERTCLVNLNLLFLEYLASEVKNCSQCTTCSHTITTIKNLLTVLTTKQGSRKDLFALQENLARGLKEAQCATGQKILTPLKTSLQHFYQEFADHAEKHYCQANICAELMRTGCSNACPAQVDLPGTIALMQKGDYQGAVALGRDTNPFFLSCGRVCEDPPCQKNCRRLTIDEAIDSRGLHRFAGEKALQWSSNLKAVLNSSALRPGSSTGKKVAIVGAGPAGLGAAYFLARYGHKPVLFEASPVAGGMMATGIPEYRLPREILQGEIDHILSLGAEIRYNTRLGRDFSLRELRKKYDAVFLALGCQGSRALGIPGENLQGVSSGIDFLSRLHLGQKPEIGQTVAVIGGGNVAIDAARCARRLGANKVTIYYRRALQDMPASQEEIEAALVEGIEIKDMVAPQGILGEKGKVTGLILEEMKPGPFDSGGRPKPVSTGTTYQVGADTILTAVGQTLLKDDLSSESLELSKDTVKVAKDTFMTNLEGVFAGGDCVSGPATVVAAVGMARKAAQAIHAYLLPGKENQFLSANLRAAIGCFIGPYSCAPRQRPPSKQRPLSERLTSFQEVELGYNNDAAFGEMERCICSAKGQC